MSSTDSSSTQAVATELPKIEVLVPSSNDHAALSPSNASATLAVKSPVKSPVKRKASIAKSDSPPSSPKVAVPEETAFFIGKTKLDKDDSQMKQTIIETQFPQIDSAKLVYVLVGLPARGKSYISRRIQRYLNWLGVSCAIFNAGEYRRKNLGSYQPHSFFDPNNPEASAARWQNAVNTLEDLITWLNNGGQVALYDATNTTRFRREYIVKRLLEAGVEAHRIIFLESICNDESIISNNIRQTKLKMPDYAGVPPEEAIKDFLARIKHYESAYVTLDDEHEGHLSYIKLIDVGKKIVMNNIKGYIPARTVFLLMNMHIFPSVIWLTRHGESLYNVEGKIGGDSSLSDEGKSYAKKLAAFVKQKLPQGSNDSLVIWTSTLKRSMETAEHLKFPIVHWKALDEIDSGICDGMTYEEIEQKMPEEYAARMKDKFRYRYPRGESYQDMIQRLEPVLIELERQRSPVLIIAHQAVTRVLYAYLKGIKPEDCPNVPIPLHTVIELTPNAYGVEETRYVLELADESPSPSQQQQQQQSANGAIMVSNNNNNNNNGSSSSSTKC